MRKFWIFLVILCLVTGSMTVSAENFDVRDTIAFGETKIVTIPKPEGEIDPAFIYFNQEFTFVPEEDGTYRFLVSYQEDKDQPYDIYMDVVGAYWELENGCEFDAVAGQTYNLCFQYPTHDGRYPTFTFYVGAADADVIPKTGAPGIFLPAMGAALSLAVLVICGRKRGI
jgi:LPXTG-motif cell wall-anchored protein